MKFSDSSVKVGKYEIQDGWSNVDLIRKLRSGVQTPVALTLNNKKNIYEVAGKCAEMLEADSIDFVEAFSHAAFHDAVQLNDQTILSLVYSKHLRSILEYITAATEEKISGRTQ